MNRETCKGCVHYRAFGSDHHEKCCHYIIDTGEPRGCPAKKCTHYTKDPDKGGDPNARQMESINAVHRRQS